LKKLEDNVFSWDTTKEGCMKIPTKQIIVIYYSHMGSLKNLQSYIIKAESLFNTEFI